MRGTKNEPSGQPGWLRLAEKIGGRWAWAVSRKAGLHQSTVDETVLGSLEHNGPVSGLARDTYSPALLPGLGGIAYQLPRLHRDCPLPPCYCLICPDPHPAAGTESIWKIG